MLCGEAEIRRLAVTGVRDQNESIFLDPEVARHARVKMERTGPHVCDKDSESARR